MTKIITAFNIPVTGNLHTSRYVMTLLIRAIGDMAAPLFTFDIGKGEPEQCWQRCFIQLLVSFISVGIL